MKKLVLTAAITAFFSLQGTLFSSMLAAEQLVLPLGEQTEKSALPLPQRGMHKESVRRDFGDPEEVTDAVGEPPISQWRYAQYVVYFEGNQVIRAVVKHPARETD